MRKKCLLNILMLFCGLLLFAQKDTIPAQTSILKRTSLAPIPIVSYNRSYGWTGGLMLNAFTKINPKDTISPASMTGIGFGYTQNKSWFVTSFQRLYLKNDKLRIFWALGLGKSNFQFFQENDDLGNGTFIEYNTTNQFFSSTVTYNVYKRFYTGLKFQYSKSTTEFDTGLPTQVVHLSGFGIPLSYDGRDSVYNASNGFYINAVFNNNTKWLGSDIEFSSLSFNANYYKRLNAKSVLASRFFTYTGLGDVPFIGQKVIGGKDLRGYTKGEYRSNTVMAIQSEYRYNLYKKWGTVGFAGLGYAFESNGVKSSGILPSAGAGLRYQVIPKQRMNIGFDAAVGKNDWGIYFRVGEVF